MSLLDVQVKHHSAMSEFQRRMGAPLVEIASIVLQRVHARSVAGQGPSGPLTPLGASSRANGVRFWAHPNGPQPAGYLYRVETGKWAGYAVYADYRTFATLHHKSRTLRETGDGWNAAAVKLQSPTRATAAFYGSHKSGDGVAPTGAIMHAAVKHEAVPLFRLNAEDRRVIREIVTNRLTRDLVESSLAAGKAFGVERKAASLGRRFSKLLGDR